MRDLERYEILNEAAIPPGGVPPSHQKLDVHGALYPTGSPTVCLALGKESPEEFVEAYAPIREISVVRESEWSGPFSPPTYSIYAPAEVEARLYEVDHTYPGTQFEDDQGEDRYYYGFDSIGYWHRWSEWRRESGPFVSIREAEIPRLTDAHGYGEIIWMGIAGWSVLEEPKSEGSDWVLSIGDSPGVQGVAYWATKGKWAPGDGLPEGVMETFDREKKDLCEMIAGRKLTDEEYENLGSQAE